MDDEELLNNPDAILEDELEEIDPDALPEAEAEDDLATAVGRTDDDEDQYQADFDPMDEYEE